MDILAFPSPTYFDTYSLSVHPVPFPLKGIAELRLLSKGHSCISVLNSEFLPFFHPPAFTRKHPHLLGERLNQTQTSDLNRANKWLIRPTSVFLKGTSFALHSLHS